MDHVGQRVALVFFAVALAGCERGCLTRWISENRDGARPTASVRGHDLDLGGVDCADGLLRCNAGVVETSRVAHLAADCAHRAKGEKQGSECACPWDVVAHCTTGCADENRTIIATDVDAGATQMCRSLMPFARPVLPEDHAPIDVCSDDGITCRDGIVSRCVSASSPSQPLAHCIFGCAIGVSLDDAAEDGPTANPDGPVSILCVHNSSERR